MTGLARYRALLVAVVALVLLGGLALVSMPSIQRTAPDQAPTTALTAPTAPPRTGQEAPGQDGVPADAARTEAITRLLAARSDALLRRDEPAFVATLDPQADPAFRQAQQALFDNLAGVPLRQWSYLVQPQSQLDVASLSARTTADELWAPDVQLSYALDGVDTTPTQRPMGYLFARHGGSWYLRSDDELAALGRRTWRGPWDFGPCQAIRTAQGVVLFHPGRKPMADRLALELDPAVAAVSEVWGTGWPQRVGVVLPDSADEMRALVGNNFPVDAVVAVSVADRVDPARHTAEGQRVVLSPGTAERMSAAALRIVLRHEMTHIAARGYTVDGAPMWLLEGFADYVGHRDSGISLANAAPDLAARMVASGPPESLPADQDFLARGADLELAYQESYSLALFVGQRLGEPKLVELYHRLAGAGRIEGAQTDVLLREVIGLDREGLLAAWQEYLRETLG